jgi:DNA-binding winged helix-turn-helix (wHTH) protein
MRDGEPIAIKPKALDMLLLLVRHPGRLLGKEELMNRLWPDTAVEEANLTQNVFVVRKALGEAPGEQRFIATVARQGYRFVANVREVTEEGPSSRDEAIPGVARAESPRVPRNDDVERSAEGSDVIHATSDDQRSALSRFRALNRLEAARWVGPLVVAVAGISVVIYLSRADGSHRLRPVPVTSSPGMERVLAPTPDGRANRVAVALFENRTGDVSLEPLGQLAADRTIRAIAGVTSAHVVPRPIRMATGPTGSLQRSSPAGRASVPSLPLWLNLDRAASGFAETTTSGHGHRCTANVRAVVSKPCVIVFGWTPRYAQVR